MTIRPVTGVTDQPRFYKTSEIAKMFGVTSYTVREWCASNLIGHVRLPSGQLRIPHEAMVAFANERYGSKPDGTADTAS